MSDPLIQEIDIVTTLLHDIQCYESRNKSHFKYRGLAIFWLRHVNIIPFYITLHN